MASLVIKDSRFGIKSLIFSPGLQAILMGWDTCPLRVTALEISFESGKKVNKSPFFRIVVFTSSRKLIFAMLRGAFCSPLSRSRLAMTGFVLTGKPPEISRI